MNGIDSLLCKKQQRGNNEHLMVLQLLLLEEGSCMQKVFAFPLYNCNIIYYIPHTAIDNVYTSILKSRFLLRMMLNWQKKHER